MVDQEELDEEPAGDEAEALAETDVEAEHLEGGAATGCRSIPSGGRLLGVTAAGVLLSNACAVGAATFALAVFYFAHAWYVPPELYVFPAFLQYPHGEALRRHVDGHWSTQHEDDELAELGRQASAAARAPGRHGSSDQHADGPAFACAGLHVSGLPTRALPMPFDADVALAVPAALEGFGSQPVMCALQLLNGSGSEVASSSRPLLVSDMHWGVRLWSAAMWGPFIALGLMRAERQQIVIPLLEEFRMPSKELASIEGARICLSPPLPVYDAHMRLHFRLPWPWRFVQKYPRCSGLATALTTGAITWIGTSAALLLLYLLLGLDHRRQSAAADAPIDNDAAEGSMDAGSQSKQITGGAQEVPAAEPGPEPEVPCSVLPEADLEQKHRRPSRRRA